MDKLDGMDLKRRAKPVHGVHSVHTVHFARPDTLGLAHHFALRHGLPVEDWRSHENAGCGHAKKDGA